jgi:3-deoxy-manno-octulosonate cytidylyltransferase (CMP-KDO synthetase)
MRFRVAIPARYASTRLPGKPLRIIAGRPMIEYVYHQSTASGAEEVVIATDDPRIRTAAEAFGAKVCMTAAEHRSGTDRIAELAERLGWADDTIVVNVQADEPLIPPDLIYQAAADLSSHPEAGIATVSTPIQSGREIFDVNVVKVVTDSRGYALYFSRAPIPFHRKEFGDGDARSSVPADAHYSRHLGLYAYRTATLKQLSRLPPSMLELTESLEQLRALWNGIRIHVKEIAGTLPLSVDTERDLARVEAYLAEST